MKKSIVFLLLITFIFGFSINSLASKSILVSKVAQDLVINSDLSNSEIKVFQSKLKKQIDANVDSELLLDLLQNKDINSFIKVVNKIEILKNNKIPSNKINQLLRLKDFEELNPEKIINEYKSADTTKYNTRQLRVNANYRVNLSDIHPKTGEMYWVPSNVLGTPDTKISELKKLIGKPKELQKEIDVLYEALAYIQVSNIRGVSGNIEIKNKRKDIEWEFPAPAEYSIKKNKANCAAMTNIINYLLHDDYEEVGSLWYHRSYILGDRRGGHVINYIKHKNKYYIFDALAYRQDKEHFSSPENGTTYSKGDKAGCIHEIVSIDGKPNFQPYIDFIINYNKNIAFISLISEYRYPVMGTGIADHNHDTDIYISDRINMKNINKIYDNPDDPQVLIEERVEVDLPLEYKDYKPYKNM